MLQKIITSTTSKFRVCDSYRDASGNKIPMIYGPLSFEETGSFKGYRYREGFWQHVLSNAAVRDKIESHTMLGMIEHPIDDDEYLSTPYDKASHVVYDVQIKKGTPYGTLALINNVHGNCIKALVDLNVPIGVSTRGCGDILQDSVSTYVDEQNYALITWDITRKPNLEQAVCTRLSDSALGSPLFKELVSSYQLRDSADTHYNRNRLNSDISRLVEELSGEFRTRLIEICNRI